MARSCDLGFTAEPPSSERRKAKNDEKPLGYGQYISIWKKQKDGAWKVEVDVGGAVPSARKVEDPPTISISPATEERTPAATTKALSAPEKWFTDTAKTDSTSALVGASSEEILVQREGVFPAAGRQPAALMLSVQHGKLTSSTLGSAMSGAGDLAYRYGKYTLEMSQSTERGYYLQIWQTDAARCVETIIRLPNAHPARDKENRRVMLLGVSARRLAFRRNALQIRAGS